MKIFWDPVRQVIDKNAFNEADEIMRDRYDAFRKNKNWFFIKYVLLTVGCFLPVFVIMWIGVTGLVVNMFILIGLFFVAFLWMIFSINWIYQLKNYVHSLQRDVLKRSIANRNGWTYSSVENLERGALLKQDFPEIFNIGIEESVEDEFWGLFRLMNGKENDFYSCIMKCYLEEETQIMDYDSSIFVKLFVKLLEKNFDMRPHVHLTVHAIKLNKKIKSPLLLLAKKGNRFLYPQKYNMKELPLESAKFNELYAAFFANGINQADAIKIFQALPPLLQEQISKFGQSHSRSFLYFKEDTFFAVSEGLLFPNVSTLFLNTWKQRYHMKTNFLKKVSIDLRDESSLKERFESLFNLANNTAKYLD